MSATRRGSRVRDPSVPPPVDPELTRLSVRWTYRSLRSVIAVWLIAGLVGASFDALSPYRYLTWILAWGGRGGAGFAWKAQVSKGDLALCALAVTGPAVVSSLIGASRMSTAARTGRPHRGPSLWSIAGLAPQVLGVFGGLIVGISVRQRYNPWSWADRLGRTAPNARYGRRPGARVTSVRLDPTAAVLTATFADGSQLEYAGVDEQVCELVSDGAGRSGSIPIAQIAEVRLAGVTYAQGSSVVSYALVLDADGATLLRASAGGGAAVSRAEAKRLLPQMWVPLDVPVTRYGGLLSRPKDLRRCWPEAFSWVHAYPVFTTEIAAALWMVIVVPLLTTSSNPDSASPPSGADRCPGQPLQRHRHVHGGPLSGRRRLA